MTNTDQPSDKPTKKARKKSTKKAARAKGGKARAAKMTKDQRSEAARKAAQARWAQKVPEVICGSERSKLVLGEVEVECYVLDDERRVLSQRGLLRALSMSRGGLDKDRIQGFINQKILQPFVTARPELQESMNPIQFRIPVTGRIAYGYRAELLAEICEIVLAARRDKKLVQRQEHIAVRCEILMSAFAKVGIIALVDEATGYQYVRNRRALEEILDQYISEKLVPWTKQFPDEYYIQMFRLRGWTKSPLTGKRPGVVGSDTVDIVYDRLAPGVKDELIRLVERNKAGKPKHKLHQRLTEDVGHDELRQHLVKVVTLMSAAATWSEFKILVDRALPRQNGQLQIPEVMQAPNDSSGA